MSNETLARLLATHQLEYFDGTCTGCDWDYADEPEGDDVELVIYHARHVANLVAAAGYRKPRTIETVEELDALPATSVVRESDTEEAWFKASNAWLQPGRDWAYDTNCIGLPATVLYVPEES